MSDPVHEPAATHAEGPSRNDAPGARSWIDVVDDRVDTWWGHRFRGRPLLDRAYYTASELGDFSLIWLLIAAANGLRSDEHDLDASLRLGAALLVESLVVNQGVKRFFKRARPVEDAPRPHNLRKPSTSSFPSGHASAAFTAAGLLADRDPRARPLIYGLAAFVATSRVHVRIHHASDVVGGAVLGIAFAEVARRIRPLPPRRAGTRPA